MTSTSLIRETVYRQLKEAILTCALRPGTEIREQVLAKEFQTSKSPIRDALLRLESEGLVLVSPRKGYRVSPVSMGDAVELYEMRSLLETQCVRRACTNATEAGFAYLGNASIPPQDYDMTRWLTYNRNFHLALGRICGNRRLASTTAQIIEAFDRLTCLGMIASGARATVSGDVFEINSAQHLAIAKAVRDRDTETAVKLLHDHIKESRDSFFDSMASIGPMTDDAGEGEADDMLPDPAPASLARPASLRPRAGSRLKPESIF